MLVWQLPIGLLVWNFVDGLLLRCSQIKETMVLISEQNEKHIPRNHHCNPNFHGLSSTAIEHHKYQATGVELSWRGWIPGRLVVVVAGGLWCVLDAPLPKIDAAPNFFFNLIIFNKKFHEKKKNTHVNFLLVHLILYMTNEFNLQFYSYI